MSRRSQGVGFVVGDALPGAPPGRGVGAARSPSLRPRAQRYGTPRSSLRWPGSLALVAVITALLATVAVPAGAGDGDLDPRFGGGGTVVLPLPPLADGTAEGVGVRVQPDGRVVVLAAYYEPPAPAASALLLYRLLPRGALDPSFGSGGIVVLDGFGGFEVSAAALELAPEGKIVVGGSLNALEGWQWMLFQRLDDGSPDPTFGGGTGWMLLNFDGHYEELLRDLAVGADGSIVAVGSTRRDAAATEAGFARITPDGWPDSTFGAGGYSTADLGLGFPDRFTSANNVLLEPLSGALVFAGQVAVGSASFWAMGRIGSSGSFDPSFNAVGYRVGNFAILGEDALYDHLVFVGRHADGSYGGTGDFWPVPEPLGARVRLDANGSIDDSWGFTGFTSFEFGPAAETTYSFVAACALDPAERTICVGSRGAPAGEFAGIARFVGPTYDTRYRGGGSDYFGFANPATSWASDVTLDPNGRIVVAGTVLYPGGLKRAAVARLIGGLPFTDGFESGDLSGWPQSAP